MNATRQFVLSFGIIFGALFTIRTSHAADDKIAADHDILFVLRADGNYSTVLSALQDTGLDETLRGRGPFTFFAPTDSAFKVLANSDTLFDKPRLRAVLSQHIVSVSQVASADLAGVKVLTSLHGETLYFRAQDGIWVNDARIVQPDLSASNGVIHGVDKLFINEPAPTLSETKASIEDGVKNGAQKVYSGLNYGAAKTRDGFLAGARKLKGVFTHDE